MQVGLMRRGPVRQHAHGKRGHGARLAENSRLENSADGDTMMEWVTWRAELFPDRTGAWDD